jgi:HPt (histidine-containing phosphotransfer) domain-containing protein
MISIAAIARERGIDEEFVWEFLQEFYDYTVDSDFPELRRAIVEGNLITVSERAHSIKGAAYNLMLDDMAVLAERIVADSRAGMASNLAGLSDSLEEQIDALGAFLRESR